MSQFTLPKHYKKKTVRKKTKEKKCKKKNSFIYLISFLLSFSISNSHLLLSSNSYSKNDKFSVIKLFVSLSLKIFTLL